MFKNKQEYKNLPNDDLSRKIELTLNLLNIYLNTKEEYKIGGIPYLKIEECLSKKEDQLSGICRLYEIWKEVLGQKNKKDQRKILNSLVEANGGITLFTIGESILKSFGIKTFRACRQKDERLLELIQDKKTVAILTSSGSHVFLLMKCLDKENIWLKVDGFSNRPFSEVYILKHLTEIKRFTNQSILCQVK